MNTAISEIEMVKMVKPTSPAPLSAASNGSSPSSMRRQITSSMTMASSTTKPTATDMAISERLSRLKFSGSIRAAVASSDSGITRLGIRVARRFKRKVKITTTTSPMVISSVTSTSCTEARIVWVRSEMTSTWIAGGMLASRPGRAARMRSTVWMTFEPGCL